MFDTYEKLNLSLALLLPGDKVPYGKIGSGASYDVVREHCDPTSSIIQYNVGILHGNSHTCCIDIDDLELFWDWFYQYQDVFRPGAGEVNGDGDTKDERDLLGPASVYRSGRPNRLKLLYQLDKPIVTLSLQHNGQHIGELRCVDSQGNSKYDVLPPSVHPDGTSYTWDYGTPKELRPLPPWFEQVWRREAELQVTDYSEKGTGIHGPIKWFDDKHNVLEYAKEVGFIDVSEGFVNGKWMYCESSSLGTGKGHGITELPIGNKLHCFHESAGFHHPISPSDLLGWSLKRTLPVYTNDSVSTHITSSQEWQQELNRVHEEFINSPQYTTWLWDHRTSKGEILPTQFLERIAEEFYMRMHKKSMSLARGIVISMCAGLTAGKFSHHSQHTPCNLYMLFIGDSGSGKGSIDKFLNITVGMGIPIKEMPHSDSALVGDLLNARNTTFIIDEYGSKLLKSDNNTRATLVSLRECYGKHDSILRQRSYSIAKDVKPDMAKILKKIVRGPVPNLALITQWATISNALTDLDALSGDIARLTPYFLEEATMEFDEVRVRFMPSDIILYITSLAGMLTEVVAEDGDQQTLKETKPIQETKLAHDLRRQYYNEMNFRPGSMLHTIRNRRYENYMRMCCALAAFSYPDSPIVTDNIARYCLSIMKKNGDRFDREYLRRNVKESPFTRVLEAVIEVLTAHGGSMKKVALRDKCSAYQHFTYNKRHGVVAQDRLLQEGTEQEILYVDLVRGGFGRPTQIVKLADVPVEGEVKYWT